MNTARMNTVKMQVKILLFILLSVLPRGGVYLLRRASYFVPLYTMKKRIMNMCIMLPKTTNRWNTECMYLLRLFFPRR